MTELKTCGKYLTNITYNPLLGDKTKIYCGDQIYGMNGYFTCKRCTRINKWRKRWINIKKNLRL
jgi:hypothetical protein